MKTHKKVLEETEQRLFKAMLDCDIPALHKILDVDFVFTSETGKMFKGINNQPIINPEVLCVKTIEIIEHDVVFFNNVAIVNSLEKRSGDYLGIAFNNIYRLARIWKFNGRNWILIGSVASIL